MKALGDPQNVLAEGLATIRQQYKVPEAFPPDVLAEANTVASKAPTEHVDRTAMSFVTLDPATSTDLDQAFTIERRGNDLLLHYAIADVAWFVADGGAIDQEAWKRGTTIYLPDGKAGLHPPVLAEGAASLLPDGPRPAVIFTICVAPDGGVKLEGAERAIVRSKAKLAYETVRDSDLPPDFAELSTRIEAAETARGASRVDPPEQEVESLGNGRYQLVFKPRLQSEDRNAAMSLAANLAIADALLAHKTGLFRVMPEPNDAAVARLRHTARALHLDWPAQVPLADYERGLKPDDAKQAAFMLAIRRAGDGASYQPYHEGVKPWHAAMAATYTQATAPLRRLSDRYVVRAMLAVANGQPVPEVVTQAFEKLPPVMAKADGQSGQIDRAVVDMAEAAMLHGREGETFTAIVTDIDDRGARFQLRDEPVVARVDAHRVEPGQEIQVRLIDADPERRQITFQRLS